MGASPRSSTRPSLPESGPASPASSLARLSLGPWGPAGPGVPRAFHASAGPGALCALTLVRVALLQLEPRSCKRKPVNVLR